jgi:sugar phosphate isomerase/epimerase
MLLGIMSRMLSRPRLEQVADAVRASGLKAVQLNLASAGLPSLPAELDLETAVAMGVVFSSRGLKVAAVSGTFNAIHPDPGQRAESIRRLGVLASRCRALGTGVITLCTGTRDPDNTWRFHRANGEPEAWRDLVATFRHLLCFAEEHDLTFAFEPDAVNVVDTARKARLLIEEVGSPRLRVLLDPANLVRPADLPASRGTLADAFSEVGCYIAHAHAKDVAAPLPGESECRLLAPGKGSLDFQYYIALLRSVHFDGALVMHDLDEADIPGCRSFLQQFLGEGC